MFSVYLIHTIHNIFDIYVLKIFLTIVILTSVSFYRGCLLEPRTGLTVSEGLRTVTSPALVHRHKQELLFACHNII